MSHTKTRNLSLFQQLSPRVDATDIELSSGDIVVDETQTIHNYEKALILKISTMANNQAIFNVLATFTLKNTHENIIVIAIGSSTNSASKAY